MPLTTVARPARRDNLERSSFEVVPPINRRLRPERPSVLPTRRQIIQQVAGVAVAVVVVALVILVALVLVARVHVGRALGQREAAEQAIRLVVGAGGEVELVGVEGGVV